MKQTNRGFTLTELTITLAIVALIAAIALPLYQQQLISGRQAEARAALLENAHFMERWYTERGSYKQSNDSWPTLPISATELFNIDFSANAQNVDEEHYLLQAKPKPEANWLGDTFIELDQDGNMKLCKESGPSKKCRLK